MADNLKKLFVNIDNNQPLFSGILESDKGPALKYLQMSNFDFKAANALVQHFLSDQYRQIKKGDAVAVDMAVLDTPVGGVDFNAQDLNIQATVGSTQTFEYDVAQFREGFEGFRPVIINAYNIVSINELLATVP
jgi:hypothetical protein